jgi:hypothetical protein
MIGCFSVFRRGIVECGGAPFAGEVVYEVVKAAIVAGYTVERSSAPAAENGHSQVPEAAERAYGNVRAGGQN